MLESSALCQRISHLAICSLCDVTTKTGLFCYHKILWLSILTPGGILWLHVPKDGGCTGQTFSTQKELAVGDLSQNNPVSRSPVHLQNIIQPTPERSTAFFLSYVPSIIQIRVPFYMPSAIQVVCSLVLCVALMPSHIQVPPHLAM